MGSYLNDSTATILRRPLMDAQELADLTGWSLQRIWDLARRGLVPHVKVGRRVFFPRRSVEAWLEGGQASA